MRWVKVLGIVMMVTLLTAALCVTAYATDYDSDRQPVCSITVDGRFDPDIVITPIGTVHHVALTADDRDRRCTGGFVYVYDDLEFQFSDGWSGPYPTKGPEGGYAVEYDQSFSEKKLYILAAKVKDTPIYAQDYTYFRYANINTTATVVPVWVDSLGGPKIAMVGDSRTYRVKLKAPDPYNPAPPVGFSFYGICNGSRHDGNITGYDPATDEYLCSLYFTEPGSWKILAECGTSKVRTYTLVAVPDGAGPTIGCP